MLITKEQEAGIRITFEDTDNFNVHITKEDPVLKHYELYVTEIQEDKPAEVMNTKTLVETLKQSNEHN